MSPPSISANSDVLKEPEVCALLHIERRTLLRWRKHPHRPLPYCKVGRRAFYLRTALLTWLTQHTEHPTAATPRAIRRRAREAPKTPRATEHPR